MSFHGWVAAIGVLLLLMALSSAYIRRLPITSAVIYLGIGLAAGPAGLSLLTPDLDADVTWVERLTEVAVIAALFVSGLTLRLPLRHHAWRAPLMLAGPGMLLTIVGVALALVW
ncbi:MAG: cation:proton antiporter, partial [Acidobacteria bacterium]|nr:cation:proton antiporter [Acidobacteriota bacterium]